MTKEEWLKLEVGDLVVDTQAHGSPTREVLRVSRVSGCRGQGGNTRTTISVPSLKSAGKTVLLDSNMDVGGGARVKYAGRKP